MIANYSGGAWLALMSLVFVPFYIKFMGIGSYGLLGIFASLQSIFSLLDMGLSTTLNREMAILSAQQDKAKDMRDIVRTLEIIYWGIGVLVALAIIALAWPISHYWVRSDKLPLSTVYQALTIMGVIIAVQWPISFYSGGLRGLQKHVILNCINVGIVTLQGVGAILILWRISPTIQAFFTWQIIVSLFGTFITAALLWANLPKAVNHPRFQKKVLLRVWRFAGGMTAIFITTMLLTQIDKIVLSKMLTLEMFGYYTLAAAVAKVIYNFQGPIYASLFPRLCQLISLPDHTELIALYHKACQLLSVMVLPAAMVIALFSSEIMFLWTGNRSIVSNTQYLISVLVIANACNALMCLPGGLTYADGWTDLALYTNIIAIFILTPMTMLLIKYYGTIGAAVSWLVLNSGYVLIVIHIVHMRLLKSEKKRWYFIDVGLPLLGALSAAFLWRIFAPDNMSRGFILFYLVGVSITTLISSAVLTPYTRFLIGRVSLRLCKCYG